MRIVSWNCNMAFRNKAQFILLYRPDILIVPECEHPDKLIFKGETQTPTSIQWFGTNKNKGLGIFSYGSYKLTLLDIHNRDIKMVIPLAVEGGETDFTLFAVWANNPGDPDGTYVEQVWKAIHLYENNIIGKPTILAGDFNSNTIWDKKHRAGNHSNVVARLEDWGILSSYHSHYQQQQGKEEHSTLYMYRNEKKGYHVDYCFVSSDLAATIQSVEVGEYNYWKQFSDHVPLIVTFS